MNRLLRRFGARPLPEAADTAPLPAPLQSNGTDLRWASIGRGTPDFAFSGALRRTPSEEAPR